MRKQLLLILVLVLGLLSPARAAWVQSHSHYDYPSANTQFTVPSVGPGNTLILSVRLSTSGTTTVTSPGLTWVKDAHVNQEFVNWTLDVWRASNVPGGNTPITLSITGGTTSIRIIVNEYSGLATSSPVHRISIGSNQGATVNAGSVITTAPNVTLFTAGASDGVPGGWTAGPNYTLRNSCENSEPGQKICTEDRGPVVPGTYSGNFTMNSSDVWSAILIAYLPAGPQDTTPPATPTGLTIISP